jgi:voltage-gated potassium channel
MSKRNEPDDSGAILPGDPRERRRLVVKSALRILAATAALLALYALVPIPGASGIGALIGLIIGLLVFVGLVGWQLRAIAGAENPVLRAVEVVALALPLLTVVFAFTYVSISDADPAAFSEPLNRVGALYYTVVTLSTVGYGDISPVSDAARILVTIQLAFDIALIAGLARVLVLATRTGLQRRSAGDVS